MLRRSFLGAAAAVGAASFLPTRPALAQSARQRTLRFVPQADVTILDPLTTSAYVTRNHALLVFDQLFAIDGDLRPQPQMVEGYTVEDDGKRWTFRMREGLKFHDGEPVRGRDCVASIRRWAPRDDLGQLLLARTDAMEAPDDRSFTIRLNRPYGLMLATLSKLGPPALLILPERLAVLDPKQQLPEVVGSGPFRFNARERIIGARVVYDRNPDYVPRADGEVSGVAGPKRVHFDRVEWTTMPDPSTAAAALKNGEVDWWENPINDLLPTLGADRGIVTPLSRPAGDDGHRGDEPPAPTLRQACGSPRAAGGTLARRLHDRDQRDGSEPDPDRRRPFRPRHGYGLRCGSRRADTSARPGAVEAGPYRGRLQGRARGPAGGGRSAAASRDGRCDERPPTAPRHERATRRLGLGQHGHPPGQQGASGPGWLEHLLHRLVRLRHAEPGGRAGVALRRRADEASSAGPTSRRSRRCVGPGSRRRTRTAAGRSPTISRRSRCRRCPTCPSASISAGLPIGTISGTWSRTCLCSGTCGERPRGLLSVTKATVLAG